MANIITKITLIFNSILGITNRVLQICYYAMTRKNDYFLSSADTITLTFIILPLGLNLLIILTFVLFHYEPGITFLTKIKSFFVYIISSELLLPMGVHESFKTKYSENADNPIVTMKILNSFHALFVAVPQNIIISINSSARDNFEKIDIASMVFSAFFLVWSIIYYFLCTMFESDYDDLITNIVYKNE